MDNCKAQDGQPGTEVETQDGEKVSSQRVSSDPENSAPRPLAGYLNKLSGKGPLKGFKRRWVAFNETNAKLCFYRTHEDLVPLTEIDIKSATFSFDATMNSVPRAYLFKIITPSREYALEATDQKTCLFWLTELQKLRKLLVTSKSPVKFNCSSTIPGVPTINANKAQRQQLTGTTSGTSISSNAIFYDNKNHVDLSPPKPSSAKSIGSAPRSSSPAALPSASSPATKHKGLSTVLSRFRKSDNSLVPKASSTPCQSCKENEEQIFLLTDDLLAVKNEFQASREVIKLLQQQLEVTMNEKETYQGLLASNNIPETVEATLKMSVEQASSADVKLKDALIQVERLKNENEILKNDNENLKQQVNVLQELMQTKDETVMSLTHEIFDLQSNTRVNVKPRSFSAVVRTTEVENLQDSVKAYQIQNEFLNKEVVELNEIRNANERMQRELELKCYEWEAKCCQVQSKLLSLLKEIKAHIELTESGNLSKCISSNEAVKALVNRLLDESSLDIPLSWHPGNRKRTESSVVDKTASDYDDLGFSNRPQDAEDAIEMLANKADYLKVKTEEMKDSELVKSFALWKARWDTFVGSLGNGELQRSQELKHMLRSGVPQEYRCKIWKSLINLRVKQLKAQCGNDYYKALLDSNLKLNIAAKQIELDLLRTLPNNKHFETLQSDGTCRLRRVLTAYSRHNPAVGYCQGMNRLAAVALLFMPEEDAFWCLVAIIEKIMPREYYTNNLLGAHVDQYTFRDLLAEKLVTLHNHLESHGVEISLFSWFLTCFVDSVPVKIYLRIWDVFLYEGSKVMFRFALAFLKYHEEEILKMNDSVAINQFLRGIGEKTTDVKQLCHIAFTALNPFPMSKVRAKRIYYTNLVSNELQKLEEIRRSLPTDESRNCDSQSD